MKHLLLLVIATLITFKSEAHPPWGIVVDSTGNIYFADIFHNGRGSLWKLDSEGNIKLIAGDFHAHNVSLDQNGNLVSAHGENTYTMIAFREGIKDTLIHTTDFKKFNGGTSTYANGTIYFGIEHYIWKINEEGKREKLSDHYFEWNQLLYADGEGNVYAPDIGKNGDLIKIDPNGNATVIATDLISQLDRPKDKHNDILLGIGKDAERNVYICELAGQKIIKIDPDGNTSDFYKANDKWAPTAVTFQNKQAYILEIQGHDNLRVIRLDENGVSKVLFDYNQDYDKKVSEPSSKGNSTKSDSGISMFVWIFSGAVVALILFGWIMKRPQNKSTVL